MTTDSRPRDAHGRFIRHDMVEAVATVGGAGPVLPGEEFSVAEVKSMVEAFQHIETQNYQLSERLENVDMMVDQQGWKPLFQYDDKAAGISLDQLKHSSEQLRELTAANPAVKNGARLRVAGVWAGGIEFMCKATSSRAVNQGLKEIPEATQRIIDSPRNQRYLFSDDAFAEMERAAYTDGTIFLLWDQAKKTFQRIPISQITADLRNPENHEEIWAYRREWWPSPTSTQPMVEWIYTDIHDERRARFIENPNLRRREKVAAGKTMIDKTFNRQVGWPYGVPDALAALAWARLYREFLVNGYIQSRALAKIAYKIVASTQQGAMNAAEAVSRPGEGSAAVMGGGTDLSPLATAGKGYDFDSGRPLAAQIASAVEVSLVALLGDPGAGGGSYGTAKTLDGPTLAMAVLRQRSWNEMWVRVFRIMGLREKLDITWGSMREDLIHREVQAIVAADGTGLFASERTQRALANLLGWADPGPVPAGRLIPNNEKSLPRKDIDADGTSTPSPAAGSGQGQSNGGGGAGDDHDDDAAE